MFSCHVDQSFLMVHGPDMTGLMFNDMCPNLGFLIVSYDQHYAFLARILHE